MLCGLITLAGPWAALEVRGGLPYHTLELTAPPQRGRRRLTFTPMGGAYNRPSESATAYAHRDQVFLLEHIAPDGDAWVGRSWMIAHEDGSGRVNPNFPDSELDDPLIAYHGANLSRLTAKHAYDPDRFFDFPQCV